MEFLGTLARNCPVPQTIHFTVTTSQIATCILLPCKRKAPLLYLPASPKQILNRRDLKRRSSPPCVRLGSPPGLNLFLQPARSSGLFLLPSFRARNRARVSRTTMARLRARKVRRRATPRLALPPSLARVPLLAPHSNATPLTHFHRFPLVFVPHATSHPKSL